MPATENLGYGERPKLFRTTITLPFELKDFILTRAKMFKRAGGGPNVSAYYVALTRKDQAAFTKVHGAGKRGDK